MNGHETRGSQCDSRCTTDCGHCKGDHTAFWKARAERAEAALTASNLALARAIERADKAEAERDRWRGRAAKMEIERNRAHTVIEKVRALHTDEDDEEWCDGCEQAWPCPTVRLLPEVTP